VGGEYARTCRVPVSGVETCLRTVGGQADRVLRHGAGRFWVWRQHLCQDAHGCGDEDRELRERRVLRRGSGKRFWGAETDRAVRLRCGVWRRAWCSERLGAETCGSGA
jgi:hypothetical protein